MTEFQEAISKVTYDKFYIRELDWDSYSVYINSGQPIDILMINEVAENYEALSEELQNNFYIVKTAYTSYKKIINYLMTSTPQLTYEDGVSIKVDAGAMIDIIKNEHLGMLEEKYINLLYILMEINLSHVATDQFKKEIIDMQDYLFFTDNDIKVDWSDISLDIDKLFGCFKKVKSKDDEYSFRIEIYIDNIQSFCDVKKYNEEQFQTLLLKVIIHEYAHYILSTANISDTSEDIQYANEPFLTLYYEDNCWYKIIEESLCNYIAYSQKWTDEQKEFIAQFISIQADDYRYALNFIKLEKDSLLIGAKWRELQSKTKFEDIKDENSKKILNFSDTLKNNNLSKESPFFELSSILSSEDSNKYYEKTDNSYFIPKEIKEIFIL